MGGNRPNGNAYTHLDWIATLGGMVHRGTQVRATCGKCKVCMDVDLLPLLMQLGPKATLLNRRPPCRVLGCDGTVIFSASPGGATPYYPCLQRSSDG